MLMAMKQNKEDDEEIENGSNNHCVSMFSKYLEDTRTDLEFQERFSVEAANSLMAKLRAQLVPFRFVSDETTSWEEKSFAVRLVNKAHKSKRNKLWRKRKRKRIAERLAQVTLHSSPQLFSSNFAEVLILSVNLCFYL